MSLRVGKYENQRKSPLVTICDLQHVEGGGLIDLTRRRGKHSIPSIFCQCRGRLTAHFRSHLLHDLLPDLPTLRQVLVSAEKEDSPLLSLIGGSTRTVLRAASLKVTALAEAVSCVRVKTTSALTYEWSELRTGHDFMSTSAVRYSILWGDASGGVKLT